MRFDDARAMLEQRVIEQLIGTQASIQMGELRSIQVFVVGDACWAVDKTDLRGRRWPADDVHALSLAHLHGEYATVVDATTTLRAAALAKARQRRATSKA